MHHKCVKCGKMYEHAAEEILKGCTCGSKLFYFVKSTDANNKKKNVQVENEVEYFYELEDDVNNEIIVFDVESINVTSSGKYEINLDSLMNRDGLVYKYGDGKYGIDLNTNLRKLKKKR